MRPDLFRSAGRLSTAATLVALLAILAWVSCLTAFGQATDYGVVRGSVTDPTGLPVAGAKITASNQTTRETRVVSTDAMGEFVIPSLLAGLYTITAEVPGFKKLVKSDIHLTAEERADVGQLRLEVGQVTESVVVTASPTTVQTASAERSLVITGNQVAQLPSLSRNIGSYLRLMPGAVEASSISDNYTNQTDPTQPMPTISGISAQFHALSLDGISMTEDGTAGWPNGHVNPDAMAEVVILVNNYQAEYGRNGGSVVNMITKSGSQGFHGSVYTYFRNEEFNASAFFDNRQGLAKARDRYHLYGYTLGGPIYFPGKFNKAKDKLFFFWSQELTSSVTVQSSQVTVPTDLERAGNFSQTPGSVVIKDPATGVQFPGNIVPTSMINPLTQKLLNIFPEPNALNTAVTRGQYNYNTGQQPIDFTLDEATLRLDYNVSSKFRTYFRGQKYTSGKTYPWSQAFSTWADVVVTDSYRVLNGLLSASYTFSPTLVNEFSFGTKGHKRQMADPDAAAVDKLTRAGAGVNLGQFYPQFNPLGILPRLTFGGVTGGASLVYDNRYPLEAVYSDFSVVDGLTKVHNSHTFKVGVDMKFIYTKNGDGGNFGGTLDFTASTTNPLDSGYAYSNALLGNFNSYTESTSRPREFDYSRIVEWYAQDNWRLTKNLTLDYGMRFTIRWPDWNPLGQVSGFNAGLYDPAQSVVLFRPILNSAGQRVAVNPLNGQLFPAVYIGAEVPGVGNPANGMISGTTSGYPRGFMRNQGVEFGPRFGFAWDPFGDGGTSVRGGFGMNTFAAEDSLMRNLISNPPTQYNPYIYYNNVSTFLNAGTVLFPGSVSGVAVSGENPEYYNFSFGVQRKIPTNTVLDVAYVGTLGRHLWMTQNLNTLPYGTNFLPKNIDPTTGKVYSSVFLEPYIGFTSASIRQTGGTSSFHSLQAQAHHRYSKGVELDAVYTWSKYMNYGSSFPVYMPRSWNYGEAADDRTHNMKIAWIWDLPRVNGLTRNIAARTILNGWQISGFASFISGAPTGVGFSTPSGVDLTGGGDGNRINVVGNPILPRGQRSFNEWFDPTVFGEPLVGIVGNAGRNVFRGPGINDWEGSMKRDFSIREKVKLQLRLDTYNAFNHTQFLGVNSSATFDANGRQTNTALGVITSARAPRRSMGSIRITF